MILLTLYFIFYSGYYFINNLNLLFYIAVIVVASTDVIVSINYNWDISQVLAGFYEDYEYTESLLKYTKSHEEDKFFSMPYQAIRTKPVEDKLWQPYSYDLLLCAQ